MNSRSLVDIEWIALGLQALAKTLSGQVAILDAHVELLIDRLDEQQSTRQVESAASWSSGVQGCQHPEDYRMEAGSMRAPLRFFCKQCRRFVDPARSERPADTPVADGPTT